MIDHGCHLLLAASLLLLGCWGPVAQAARALSEPGSDDKDSAQDNQEGKQGVHSNTPRFPQTLEADEEAWSNKLRKPGLFQNITTEEGPYNGWWPHHLTKVRPWRREHLSRGLLAANHHQFRPMLERLNSRKPVTVLAYGSSITQDFAGCFHTGPLGTLAKRLGADRLPDWHVHYRLQGAQNGRECWEGAPVWGNMLLQVINATWPHPGNTFLNAGQAACSAGCHLNKACLESHLPAHLDLLILEMYDVSQGKEIERLLWRILSYYSKLGRARPAIVFIRSGFLADHDEGPGTTDTCLRNAGKCETECNNGTFKTFLTPEHLRVKEEYDVVALAQYYGFTVVSHRHFLSSMLRDGVPSLLARDEAKQALLKLRGDYTWGNLSDCRFLSAIQLDYIHPDPMGRLLYVDHILNALASAQEFFGWARGGDAREVPSLPKEPLYPGGQSLEIVKCTTMVDARNMTEKRTRPGEAAVLVIGAEGWHFSEYQVHGAHRKYKPGWVATTAGAALTLQINTLFPPTLPTEPVSVLISYLESYEHMGQVKASCISSCECKMEVADALNTAVHASVTKAFTLTTSPQHESCTIKVEVLQDTKSGEHKFKVLSVVAKKGEESWNV